MQKLRNYFQKTNINQFQDILKRRVIVTEKLQMPTLYVEWDGTRFKFLKNNKVELDRVDRTIQLLYEIAVKHFFAMNDKIRVRIPSNWRFGFDYVPAIDIADFEYTQFPHNNLILTHIHEMKGDKINRTLIEPEILKKWALILDVDTPNIIFDGKLGQEEKDELIQLLQLNDEAFKSKFDYDIETEKETSFTIKIFKLFNKNQIKTTLQSDLEKEIDGLILTFIDDNKALSLKLEDFLRQDKEERKPNHIQQIATTDFLEFLSQQDLSKIKLNEMEKDLMYIETMSQLFNSYIKDNATKYIGVDFEKASFADNKMFRLNTKFIKNQETLKLVSNQILAELFKIVLGTFRKKKSKETELFNKELLDSLNGVVSNILDFISNYHKEKETLDTDKSQIEEDYVKNKSESKVEEYGGMYSFKNFIIKNNP